MSCMYLFVTHVQSSCHRPHGAVSSRCLAALDLVAGKLSAACLHVMLNADAQKVHVAEQGQHDQPT